METTGYPQVMMKALHKLRSAHGISLPALDIICVWKTQHSMYTFQEYFTIGSLKTLTQEMDNSNRSPKSVDRVQPIKKASKIYRPNSSLVLHLVCIAANKRCTRISVCKVIPHISKTPSAATDTPSLSSFHIRLSFEHLRAPTPLLLLLLSIAPRTFHCSRQNSEEEERGH